MTFQSPDKPTHLPSYTLQPSALIPIYQWRGARPPLLDLDSDQTGWLVCLCLQREGDISLLPLSWQMNALDEHHMPDPKIQQIYPTIHTHALDSTTFSSILHQLQQEGWQSNGQLTMAFTGHDTVSDFQQEIQKHLWQTPQPPINTQRS